MQQVVDGSFAKFLSLLQNKLMTKLNFLKQNLNLSCSSASSEAKSSSSVESATQATNDASSSSSAAAAAVTSSGGDPVASWQLEVFGTWSTLSDVESAQIEKAYCDPNNDSLSTSVVVCLLPLVIIIIIIIIIVIIITAKC